MIILAFLIDTILALVLGIFMVRGIMRYSYKNRLFDEPDGERKIHSAPVPRLGGLSFFPVLTLVMGLSALILIPFFRQQWISPWSEMHAFIGLFISLAILYGLGLKEDLGRVRSLYKFYFYTLASFAFMGFGIHYSYTGNIFWIKNLPMWVWYIFTYLGFVHFLNAINLIDGVNGLSTDLCIGALATLGFFEYLERHIAYTLLAIAAISVLLAFRYYNTHGDKKASQRIFMGDTGCWTLGIILLFIIIHLNSLSPLHPDRPYCLIGFTTLIVPLVDMPRVGVYRMLHGFGPFHPDNNHVHHKLLDIGLGPFGVRAVILGVTALFVIFNWFMAGHINLGFLILINIAQYLLFIDILDQIRKHKK